MTDYDKTPCSQMTLLAWIDILERTDTTLLEIRHLQTNIIHSLREPIFYQKLKKEEVFIWPSQQSCDEDSSKDDGNNSSADDRNEELVKYLEGPVSNPADTVAKNIKPFPSYPANSNPTENDAEKIRLDNIWSKAGWSIEQKRNYHILRSLQTLKRNLIEDKLYFCWWGCRVFEINKNKHTTYNTHTTDNTHYTRVNDAAFMMLRSAVFAKLRNAVRHLGDLQSQFEKSQDDSSLHDNPRPSLARRREQGIYSSHLSARSVQLIDEINLLLEAVADRDLVPSQSNDIVMHSWKHDFTSHYYRMDTQTSQNQHSNPIHPNVSFIQTSYWMPERPDLQSVIAHEAAHLAIQSRLALLFEGHLVRGNTRFLKLLRQISHLLSIFFHGDSRHLLTEITADLLATATKGHAYIYAQFLETAGLGCEFMFDTPNQEYNLQAIEELGPHSGEFVKDLQWHLRLKLTICWLNQIHHTSFVDRPYHDTVMLEGIEELSDKMMRYLMTKNQHDSDRIVYWMTATDRLCQLVRKSKVCIEVKTWRKKRSRAGEKPENIDEYGVTNKRIPEPIRDHLFRNLLWHKCKEHCKSDPEPTSLEKSCKYFDQLYLDDIDKFGKSEGNDDNSIIGERPVFQHLYDIPWQCAIFRSVDFLGKSPESDSPRHKKEIKVWMDEFHYNTSLGREMYQYALEFEFSRTMSPSYRLQYCVSLLTERKDIKASKQLNGIFDNNSNNAKGVELLNDLEPLVKHIIKSDKKIKFRVSQGYLEKELDKILKKHSNAGNVLAAIGRNRGHEKPAFKKYSIRRHLLLQIATDLITKIHDELEEVIKRGNKDFLIPLKEFLSPDLQHCEESEENVVNKILENLDSNRPIDELNKNENSFYRDCSVRMLGRISISGTHDIDSGNDHTSTYIDSLNSMYEDLKKTDPKDKGGPYESLPLLGAYDLFFTFKTRPMCRCRLPPIPSDSGKERDKYPSFFTRRELGIYVPFKRKEHNNEAKFIGMIAITLTQKESRIDFLYRLIDGGISSILEENDDGYLTDGWGDIVLLFRECDIKKWTRIYDVQKTLFEDFMVDRTSLYLSPSVLEHLNNDEHYLTIQTRLMEDRKLEKSFDNIEGKILNSDSASEFKNASYELVRTPGQTDYLIKLNNYNHGTKLMEVIPQLFKDSDIDMIQTTIGLKIPKKTGNESDPSI